MSNLPPNEPSPTSSTPSPAPYPTPSSAETPQQPASGPPQQIILQPPPSAFGKYGKMLLLALGLAVMVILGMASRYRSYFSTPDKPQEKFHSLNAEAAEKIASATPFTLLSLNISNIDI